MIAEHELRIRVNYHEVDGQGRVHNSNYLNYFERGRVEMLRSSGFSYRDLEKTGLLLVVRSMHVDFHWPAVFDDELLLCTRLAYCHGARIEHHYRIVRVPTEITENAEEILIATGRSEVGCVDATGRVRRLPTFLQLNLRA